MEAKKIGHQAWNSILETIGNNTPPSEVVYGKVIRRDIVKKLVWIKEFGDQAIPLAAFDYEIEVYDESPRGVSTTAVNDPAAHKVYKKKYQAKLLVPEIGQTVVVLRQLGSRHLPKCVGVVQSTGFVVD